MQNWVCANRAPAATLAASLTGCQSGGGSIGASATPMKNRAWPAILRPVGNSPCSLIRRAIAESVVESMSNTGLVSGWSPALGSSPVSVSRLITPAAAAPMRSPWSAMRLRSRQVNCRIGSIPACTSIAAAIGAHRWARALAPSVTLTASASPRSGSALRMRSAGSNDTGGLISVVMTKRRARNASSRRETAGRGAGVAVMSGSGARDDEARRCAAGVPCLYRNGPGSLRVAAAFLDRAGGGR